MDQALEEGLELAFDDAIDDPVVDPPADEEADPDLESIHRDHFAFVWRTMRNLGVPPAALDDAVQDVFLTVHRRIEDFEGRSSLRTWLFAIARRVAYRYRRTAARQQRKLDALAEVEPTQASPYSAVAQGEALDILTSFLDSLDDAKREVFVLHTLEGVTGGEIASALGISVNTVHSRLRLARRSFERMCKTLQVREERAIAGARRSNEPPAQARNHAWALLVPMLELPREGLAAGGAWTLASQVKVFATTIAIGTASLGAVKVSTTSPQDTPSVLVSTASAASSAPAPASARPPLPPVAEPGPAPVQVTAAPPKPRRPTSTVVAREPAPAPPDPSPSLVAETRAMVTLRARIKARDAVGALSLLDELDRTYSGGAFEVERLGYRMIARCESDPGRTTHDAARRFVRDHAGSTVAEQVRAHCLR